MVMNSSIVMEMLNTVTSVVALETEPEEKPELISAPAKCCRCGYRWESPTTGKVWNLCTCGGKLETEK